jgi:hypothetical protein
MKQEPDQQAVDAARDAVLPLLAYLEKELDGRSNRR